mmetsp:Transcript_38963/g.111912  ORF Transcript_38963/g.111912 Transcript_38963/m.111912 type:complete len:136 (+) Transcript_38963:2216-2623(+)
MLSGAATGTSSRSSCGVGGECDASAAAWPDELRAIAALGRSTRGGRGGGGCGAEGGGGFVSSGSACAPDYTNSSSGITSACNSNGGVSGIVGFSRHTSICAGDGGFSGIVGFSRDTSSCANFWVGRNVLIGESSS